MVDTLAPKKVFSQRDLDKSLVSASPTTQSILSPSKSVLESSPNPTTQNDLLSKPQLDYVIDQNEIFNMMQNVKKQSQAMVSETNQTVRSSEEITKEKQTGERAQRETPQGQGLVMRPVEYAANGVKDKEVSGPILVGEKGAELVVPTGEGKVSILDAKTTNGLMQYPGYDDEMITTKEVAPELNKPMFKKKEKEKNFRGGSKNFRNQEEFIPITRADEDENFLDYMKSVENPKLSSGNLKMLKHKSAEGGQDTVGYGHKLTDKEIKTGKIYGYDIDSLTLEDVNEILKLDLSKAYASLSEKFGKDFADLDDRRKQMAIDFQFNLGGLEKFPIFTEALFAGDEAIMKKEYERSFEDPRSGEMKLLKDRNKKFRREFLDAYSQSLMGNTIRKAEKGASGVDIGKAEPAGFFFRNPRTPDKPSGLEQLFGFMSKDKDKPLGGSPGGSRVNSIVENPVSLPTDEKEPFDPNKLYDPDSVTGISIDYFYDNLEEMVEYSLKQKMGEDYNPTFEEKQAEREDLMGRYDAYFDMQLQDTDEEVEKRNFDERNEGDPGYITGV